MSNELKQAAEQALKELGEARKIVRASSSRQLAKDWDRRATDALANLRTAIQQAEAQQPVTGDLRIGVCITDGTLHATVMQHESNGAITVVATAEIDAASLHGRDCIGRMKPATTEPVLDVRCEGCGYMTHHREHIGCVRAAKQHTHPAPSVPDDDFDLICNAIDKADTITMEGDYMLDSDDCIAVVRVMQVLLSVRAAMLAAK